MNSTVLRALAVSIAAWSIGPSLAEWDRQVIDAGGIPGQEMAISSRTSLAYIPLLQQRALAVFDGTGSVSRLELDIKPTSVGYSAATGRLFVLGMFDNAVIAIDEASGVKTRVAVGPYPDNVIVDDERGRVFVSYWGGITGQGGLAIIDARTLAVRDMPLGGYVTTMALDRETGSVFLTGETSMGGGSFIAAIDAQDNLVASRGADYRAYSLAVDSRNGRVYVGALSGNPNGGAVVSRTFTIYSQPGLQLVHRVEWPTGADRSPLVFMVDPAAPGLYFSSGESTTLLRLDADGANLRTWALPLGDSLLENGQRLVNGIFGLNADPATGNVFVSSPVGSLVAEFDPRTGATDVVSLPGAVGFSSVQFWPDSSRMLVTDARDDRALTLLQRSPAEP